MPDDFTIEDSKCHISIQQIYDAPSIYCDGVSFKLFGGWIDELAIDTDWVDPNTFRVRTVAHKYIDDARGLEITVYEYGQVPFGLVLRAGKNYNDFVMRFITDYNLMLKAMQYLTGLYDLDNFEFRTVGTLLPRYPYGVPLRQNQEGYIKWERE